MKDLLMKLLASFLAGALTYALGFISCGALLVGFMFADETQAFVDNYKRGVRLIDRLENWSPPWRNATSIEVPTISFGD